MGGWITEYTNLTFAIVNGAGHEVPMYKRAASLYMYNNFLFNKTI